MLAVEVAMSKYDPLTTFLQARNGREVRMSFAEIEALLGQKLPAKSKAHRAWWSNNPSNSVMTKAWLAAGYKSAHVDIAGEKLSFVPNKTDEGFAEMKQSEFANKPASEKLLVGEKQPYRHPAWGALKGMITLLPDVDLTEPSYPDWKKLYGEDK
jgi:hypothetical protein